MALSFFVLWGRWDASWWAVNLWLALLPILLAVCTQISSSRRRASGAAAPGPQPAATGPNAGTA